MSPMDQKNQPIPPEQARALDALIASQTDTSMDEAQADLLLGFVQDRSQDSSLDRTKDCAQDRTKDRTQGRTLGRTLDRVAAPMLDSGEAMAQVVDASARVAEQPLRFALRAVLGLGLGLAAAAVLVFFILPDRSSNSESVDSSGVSPDAAGPIVVSTVGSPKEKANDGVERGVSTEPWAPSAILVNGFSRTRRKRVPAEQDLLAAWKGRWIPGLQMRELHQAAREACAAVYPWPLVSKRVSRPQGSSMRVSATLDGLGLTPSPGILVAGPVASARARALIASRWLLRRVANGSLSLKEIHVPARILLASRGAYRLRLVEIFRKSGVRLDRLLIVRGRHLPPESAELLAAVGVESSLKRLAKVDGRIQGRIVRQALLTASADDGPRSTGFLVDFLVLAHRRQPDSDRIRMAPLAELEGLAWQRFLKTLEDQLAHRARYPDRIFLERLRVDLVSRS